MVRLIRSVFRHFSLAHWGPLLVANVLCLLPFATALVTPLLLRSTPEVGLVVLLIGFLVTGQALAVTGRVLDRRFRQEARSGGTVLKAWSQAWGEGLVVAGLLLGLFSLAFQSVPFYWEQHSVFAVFSLGTLALGTLLAAGFLPYWLPARRREGRGLLTSFGRAFRLMNAQPGLAALGLLLSTLAVLASVGTFGLFPGFAGLAALHQGLWDHALEREAALTED